MDVPGPAMLMVVAAVSFRFIFVRSESLEGFEYNHMGRMPLGIRKPPYLPPFREESNETCETGRLCAMPVRDHFPLGHSPGTLFTARFVVPDLPKSHNSINTTYYDYFNIFWRQLPERGYFNQFVPQLMLGNVLANSTNYPNYEPHWLILDEWHIAAQYFFALICNQTKSTFKDTKPCWTAKAVTGRLIRVIPGELVETSFELVQVTDKNDWEWQLRIGVVGAGPNRWSMVVVKQPFMGLIPHTSWQDDIHKNVTVGSCLENYGMKSSRNYPPTWEIQMTIINNEKSGRNMIWGDWNILGGPKCSWLPQSTLNTATAMKWQRITWNATLNHTISLPENEEFNVDQ